MKNAQTKIDTNNPPYQNEKTLQITISAEKRTYVFITKLSAKRRNKNETQP